MWEPLDIRTSIKLTLLFSGYVVVKLFSDLETVVMSSSSYLTTVANDINCRNFPFSYQDYVSKCAIFIDRNLVSATTDGDQFAVVTSFVVSLSTQSLQWVILSHAVKRDVNSVENDRFVILVVLITCSNELRQLWYLPVIPDRIVTTGWAKLSDTTLHFCL